MRLVTPNCPEERPSNDNPRATKVSVARGKVTSQFMRHAIDEICGQTHGCGAGEVVIVVIVYAGRTFLKLLNSSLWFQSVRGAREGFDGDIQTSNESAHV